MSGSCHLILRMSNKKWDAPEYESLQLSLNQLSYPEESYLKNQLNTIQEGITKLQAGQRVI